MRLYHSVLALVVLFLLVDAQNQGRGNQNGNNGRARNRNGNAQGQRFQNLTFLQNFQTQNGLNEIVNVGPVQRNDIQRIVQQAQQDRPNANIVAIVVGNAQISDLVESMARTTLNALRQEDMVFFQTGIDTLQRDTTRAMKNAFTATSEAAKQIGEEERAKTTIVRSVSSLLGVPSAQVAESVDGLLDSLNIDIEGLRTKDDNCDEFFNIRCDSSSKFRTINGACNNLQKPLWGRALIPMRRFQQPQYGDNVSLPRQRGTNNQRLPSARVVSLTVHDRDGEQPQSNVATHMLMQWGQFLDHDITSTPIQTGVDESQIGCCSDVLTPAQRAAIDKDPEQRDLCFHIPIPDNDPRFPAKTCMNFVRSIQVTNTNCQTAPAEQMNQITAFIDGSAVYGSSDDAARELRTLNGGLLKESRNQLLPAGDPNGCERTRRTDFCFTAGDPRVNEQMGLASLHTVFMREHNRMARELAQLNPEWDDEELYQETRRILGAKMQHIVYNEFLAVVLSDRTRRRFALDVTSQGFPRRDPYNEQVDASIRNAFATAAYRFGHSLVRGMVAQMGRGFQFQESLQLVSSFGNTSHIIQDNGDGLNRYIRGLLTEPAASSDRLMTNMITQRLFEDASGNSLDLASLNIQRGRDHGLPPYNEWRRWCGLPVAQSFNTLNHHSQDARRRLQEAYQSPDDIDLFSGGLSETLMTDSLVGPTFACILSHQFKALKEGDRFYYERDNDVTGFNEDQLNAIKETTLSKVLCDNTDIETMQPSAFLLVGNGNERQGCDELRQASLRPWSTSRTTALDPEWAPWGTWSTCVRGQQERSRTCEITEETTRTPCPGSDFDVQGCFEPEAQWGSWTEWDSCFRGERVRTRTCQSGDFFNQCLGHDLEFQSCNDQQPEWGPWGRWTRCRNGRRRRRRTCRIGSQRVRSGCPGDRIENQRCGTNPGNDPCSRSILNSLTRFLCQRRRRNQG